MRRYKSHAAIKNEINPPIEKICRVSQKFVMPPRKATRGVSRMERRPAVAKSRGRHQVVSIRAITMQRVGVKITEDDFGHFCICRSSEQLLYLQYLDLRSNLLLDMRANA